MDEQDAFGTEALFTDLWNALHACRQLSDFQDFQYDLLEAIVRTELIIGDLKKAIKNINTTREPLRGQTRISTGAKRLDQIYLWHKSELQEMRRGYQAQLELLRLLGDTLAWHFFPGIAIRSFYQKESSGYIAGKEGAAFELQIIDMLRSYGFILMHDLTNVVRNGDLSIHGSSNFTGRIIEAKMTRRILRSGRELRQEERLNKIIEYLNTGAKQIEGGMTQKIVYGDVEPRYEWGVIEQCLQQAKACGLAATRSSDKLALYIGATPKSLKELTRGNTGLQEVAVKVGWDEKALSPRYDIIQDRRGIPTLKPITMAELQPEFIIDLLFKRLTLLVVVDEAGITNALGTISVSIKAGWAARKTGVVWNLEDADGHRMGVGLGQFVPVLFEGLSPSSFVEICKYNFGKSKDIVIHQAIYPNDSED